MADVSWIKLYTNMFDNPKIKNIRRQPLGNDTVLIWIMLITLAGRCNDGGYIYITKDIKYTISSLADDLGFKVQTVKAALELLTQYGMIIHDSDTLQIKNWAKYQNVEKLESSKIQSRERQKRWYDRQKEASGEPNANPNGEPNANPNGEPNANPNGEPNANPNANPNGEKTLDLTQPNAADIEEDIRVRYKSKNTNNTSKKSSYIGSATKGVFQAFAGEDKELLAALKEFDEFRKLKKKPLTDGARERLVQKLAKDFPKEQWILVIQQSINNGWTDIYKLKDGENHDTRMREPGKSVHESTARQPESGTGWGLQHA